VRIWVASAVARRRRTVNRSKRRRPRHVWRVREPSRSGEWNCSGSRKWSSRTSVSCKRVRIRKRWRPPPGPCKISRPATGSRVSRFARQYARKKVSLY